MCLLVIFILSFFSYPFSYPFTWLILIISFANIIAYQKSEVINKFKIYRSIFGIVLKLSIIIILAITIYRFYWKLRWYKANKSIIYTKEIMDEYKVLAKKLDHKVLFKYNYAAILNKQGDYNHSLLLANTLYKEWSDYNLEILIAHNNLMNNNFYQSEKHFRNAHHMYPSKFSPLYGLFLTYKLMGNLKLAENMAIIIKNKKVKIHSRELDSIQKDIDNFLLR